MIVEIFIPCFIDQLNPQIGFNMLKILQKLDIEAHYNPEQTCCGQPAYNAGYWDQAKTVGGKFIKDFNTGHYIVSPSASCVGMVRNSYNHLFHNSALHNECKDVQKNIFEFSEFLVDVLKIEDIGASLNAKVTYHDSCSALRECNIKSQPRKLLEKVKGLQLVEIHDNDVCCGFGGTFAAKFESISVSMGEQKVNNAIDTGADYLVSTDYSCLLHLDAYAKKQRMPLKSLHLVDLLVQGI